MSGFIYLASPYQHPDPDVRKMRYLAACRAAGWLMSRGKIVFSPIAHSHPIELHGIHNERQSGNFWKRQDIPVLRHASELMVLTLDGWRESEGVKWEIETADALQMPVQFMAPVESDLDPDVSAFDLIAHLHHQRYWSEKTFGPGDRCAGVCDHIRKELTEIEAEPGDLTEWIDVVILALDGAWRMGATPEQIVAALVAKQAKNEGRKWPDWRTAEPGKAIQHIKEAA